MRTPAFAGDPSPFFGRSAAWESEDASPAAVLPFAAADGGDTLRAELRFRTDAVCFCTGVATTVATAAEAGDCVSIMGEPTVFAEQDEELAAMPWCAAPAVLPVLRSESRCCRLRCQWGAEGSKLLPELLTGLRSGLAGTSMIRRCWSTGDPGGLARAPSRDSRAIGPG